MSKREDLLAVAAFYHLFYSASGAERVAAKPVDADAVARGMRLIDRAIVKASRELRGAR